MICRKDTDEVIEFMAVFPKLKEWIDDDPDCLRDLAKTDDSIGELSSKVSFLAFRLSQNDRAHNQLFAESVDNAFIKQFRDYEARYESVLADVFLDSLEPFVWPESEIKLSHADAQWENADNQASDQVRSIETAIEYAWEQTSEGFHDFPEGFAETIEGGVLAWERLKRAADFDLRAIIRRRELVPFVLVPNHVIRKLEGQQNKLSMLRVLKDAHDAFIFGAPFAALGLMRSILEATLRNHYSALGEDLEIVITNARLLLSIANKPVLHHLRELANGILHLNVRDRHWALIKEPRRLEQEIIRLLFILRALIEGSPQRL